jgi:hypothetical protein
MDFLVTKANSDTWFKLECYDTIEELLNRMDERHTSYIIERNHFHNPKTLIEFWDGMDEDTAREIINMKYHIIIYNGYVE